MRIKLKLASQLKEGFRNIPVVIGWTTIITLIVLITEYVKQPTPGGTATYFGLLEMVIILGASLVFGIFLIDPQKILYCVIGTICLSIVISVVYSSLYDLSLGIGEQYSEAVPGWEWEWVTWFAFLRVFRIMFPTGIILVFIGGMIGGIMNDLMWPHRG